MEVAGNIFCIAIWDSQPLNWHKNYFFFKRALVLWFDFVHTVYKIYGY